MRVSLGYSHPRAEGALLPARTCPVVCRQLAPREHTTSQTSFVLLHASVAPRTTDQYSSDFHLPRSLDICVRDTILGNPSFQRAELSVLESRVPHLCPRNSLGQTVAHECVRVSACFHTSSARLSVSWICLASPDRSLLFGLSSAQILFSKLSQFARRSSTQPFIPTCCHAPVHIRRVMMTLRILIYSRVPSCPMDTPSVSWTKTFAVSPGQRMH